MKSKKRKKFALGTGNFGVGNNIYSGQDPYQAPKKDDFGDWFLENGQMLGAILGMGANVRNFAMGGVVPNIPVEVEGQEVGETPYGQIIDFKGPSHEQGGIDVKLPKGTEIFSKRIKVGGKTMAERKKEREKRVLSLEKLLEKNGNDKLLKDSLKRTVENNEKEDVKDQEIQSMISEMKTKIAGQTSENREKLAGGTSPGGILPNQNSIFGKNSFDLEKLYNWMNQNPSLNGEVGQTSFFGPQNPDGSSGDASQYFKNTDEDDITKKLKLKGESSSAGGFTPGDITGLAGTMYSSFRPMQNTKEQRAGDTPNINAYEDFGKQGLETLDNAKGYIGGQRDKALDDIESARARITASGRNASRGVNAMRASDLAANANANAAEGDVYDNFSKQMMQLLSQQAGFENAQDSAVMGGEQARDLADRQDRDQYYSNMAQDISSKGQGIQTMGKMFNQNKRNTVSEAAINMTSENGYKWNGSTVVDKNGVNVDVSVLKADLAKINEKLPEEEKITLKEYYNLIKNI